VETPKHPKLKWMIWGYPHGLQTSREWVLIGIEFQEIHGHLMRLQGSNGDLMGLNGA
jgi:hypothetical protein